MDRRFDDELKELNNKILKMASLTEESIRIAVQSLKERDKSLAEAVLVKDDLIDAMELEIDDYSIALLAKRQPLACDLRFIAMGMKINAELERIADLAVNISYKSIYLAEQAKLKDLIDIPQLAELAVKMVKESIDSFVNRDISLAEVVISLDEEANKLRTRIHTNLIEDYIAKDSTTAKRALSLFLVAQHLERICDHAKYIAQDLIYLISAKNVRHYHQ